MAEHCESTNQLLFSDLGDETVILLVGEGAPNCFAGRFLVHKKLLCLKVPYFDKMFNGPFLKGQAQKVELPDDNPRAIKALLGWVYLDKVEIVNDGGFIDLFLCISLFKLAEKYGITRLVDQTMELIAKGCLEHNQLPNTEELKACYRGTRANSRLRFLAACCFMWLTLNTSPDDGLWKNEAMRSVLHVNPELAKVFYEMLRAQDDKPFCDPQSAPPCHYHQHAKTEPCPYGKKRRSSA